MNLHDLLVSLADLLVNSLYLLVSLADLLVIPHLLVINIYGNQLWPPTWKYS
ncbi:hypothetical protein [Peribacillus frigoritolerans]|uniref:hypothetical protein n=1 Tax=Peribacillus castrilensis TaxID=2897690 RepID=UPI00296E303E|nr:hypothetical protein [Peribacillus castrilensis]